MSRCAVSGPRLPSSGRTSLALWVCGAGSRGESSSLRAGVQQRLILCSRMRAWVCPARLVHAGCPGWRRLPLAESNWSSAWAMNTREDVLSGAERTAARAREMSGAGGRRRAGPAAGARRRADSRASGPMRGPKRPARCRRARCAAGTTRWCWPRRWSAAAACACAAWARRRGRAGSSAP